MSASYASVLTSTFEPARAVSARLAGAALDRAGQAARRLGLNLLFGVAPAFVVGSLCLAAVIVWEPPPPAEPAPLTAPAWLDVQRPFALFDAQLSGVAATDRSYRAFRHESGGGRRDQITLGRIGETPYLQVQFYRVGRERVADATLYVEAVRRASETGRWIERAGVASAVTTRLGVFEAADVTLRGAAGAQHCLAFRLADPAITQETLRISGLSCGAEGAAPARADLSCQLERLELVSSGDDAALRDVFVAAELRRDEACLPQRPGAPSVVSRNSWLESSAAPPLRRAAQTSGRATR